MSDGPMTPAGVSPSRAGRGDRGIGQPVYRIALLSNAMHQDNYARAFAQHPRLRIIAVVDEPGQEPYVARRNRAIAAQFGVPLVESLDALGRPDVDAVSVGAQIERRGRLAVEGARRGKHLWLDKPPAATLAEAEALAAAVDAAGVRSLVYSHVGAPWVAALREAIQSGAIGDLRALPLDSHFPKGDARGLPDRRVPAGVFRASPADPQAAGGGSAADAGMPTAVWTFRDPEAATDPTESSHNVIAKRELAEVGWYPLALAG